MPKENAKKMIDLDSDSLNKILKKKGLSHTELAKRVSCSRKTIDRAIKDNRISKNILVEIANQLCVNPRKLSSTTIFAGGYDDFIEAIFRLFELNYLEFENATFQKKYDFVIKSIQALYSILYESFPNSLYDHTSWEETWIIASNEVDKYCACVEKRVQLLKDLPSDDTTAEKIRNMKDYEIYERYVSDYSDYDKDIAKTMQFPSVFDHPELYRTD